MEAGAAAAAACTGGHRRRRRSQQGRLPRAGDWRRKASSGASDQDRRREPLNFRQVAENRTCPEGSGLRASAEIEGASKLATETRRGGRAGPRMACVSQRVGWEGSPAACAPELPCEHAEGCPASPPPAWQSSAWSSRSERRGASTLLPPAGLLWSRAVDPARARVAPQVRGSPLYPRRVGRKGGRA